MQIIEQHKRSASLPFTQSETEDLEQYVRTMATSMDWAEEPGIIGWICIHPIENPLLSYKRLDGAWCVEAESAYCIEFRRRCEEFTKARRLLGYTGDDVPTPDLMRTHVPPLLVLGPEDLGACGELSSVIWQLYRGEVEDMEERMNRAQIGIGVASVLMKMGEQNKLKEHRYRKPVRGLSFWFNVLKHNVVMKAQMKQMSMNRVMWAKRRVFDGLQQLACRCFGYRNLQLRINQKYELRAFRGWHAYLRWCRKFNTIRNGGVGRRIRRFFSAWKEFEQKFHEKRNFKLNSRKRLLQVVFKHIHYNLVLGNYAMSVRLRTKSSRTFRESFLRSKFFAEWKRTVDLNYSLSKLNRLIIAGQLRRGMQQWVDVVYPPQPRVPLSQRFAELREAATRHAQEGYRSIRAAALLAKHKSTSAVVRTKNYLLETDLVRAMSGKPKYTDSQMKLFKQQREDARKLRIQVAREVSEKHLRDDLM